MPRPTEDLFTNLSTIAERLQRVARRAQSEHLRHCAITIGRFLRRGSRQARTIMRLDL